MIWVGFPGGRVTPAVLAIVGAGPRGISVLERVAANAPALMGDRPVRIHLIDPYPPGPGRVWRFEQSALLELELDRRGRHAVHRRERAVRGSGPTRPVARRVGRHAADGNILVPHLTPHGLDDFIDRIVPELQERGVFRGTTRARRCATTSVCPTGASRGGGDPPLSS